MRLRDLLIGLLGAILAITGVIELIVGIAGIELSSAFVNIGGTYLLWRGIIVLSAGVFLSRVAVHGSGSQRSQAILTVASIMVWIVAGADLLTRILGSIPGGTDAWVAPPGQIIQSIAPPYSPSIVFALFTLLVVRYTVDSSTEPGGDVYG